MSTLLALGGGVGLGLIPFVFAMIRVSGLKDERQKLTEERNKLTVERTAHLATIALKTKRIENLERDKERLNAKIRRVVERVGDAGAVWESLVHEDSDDTSGDPR